VRTRIVRIGNSQGIRIPKSLLAATGLSGEVDLSIEDGYLAIRPVRKARAGWAEAAQRMAADGDDRLLDPGLTGGSEFDQQEWQWEGLGEG
jgi:antitoxin MazE